MPESAAVETLVPRKPVASTESDGTSVPLTLVVTDRDTAIELLQKADSGERTEYALAALRIGVLALKHARGQVDVDAVRHEGERLLRELKTTLDLSKSELHGHVSSSLKDYFDPASGRFHERGGTTDQARR